ncbi:hypothetical protein F0L68_40905 [Solihabitans fulvus]|uniref:Uncharacterized protein n=2 Tax=Solihabitans fulvus TaxID=1892852 RepID=A0A5B2W6K8_9PSEU|nr:hypothetical protein F0L68_40905 [Solihabitans fulvus]
MLDQDTPGLDPGNRAFDAYTAAMDAGQTPLLGHLVLYSIFDGRVTRDDLERWFRELALDLAFVPPELRPVDAFEKVTGPDGIRVSYALDDPAAGQPRGRRRRSATSRQATLMVRHVRRDKDQIVRHIVREVRDEEKTTLSYDSRLGECVFHRDSSPASDPGAGSLQVAPDNTAIKNLPETEQAVVRMMLAEVTDVYKRHCTFLTGDKLRSLIRRYVEDLDGTKVRPTGGVYFVPRRWGDTLAAMRTLVSRFGKGSHLIRIPIPDQAEMREMVIAAFTTKAKDELDQLAREIAAARRDGADDKTIQKLHRRFTELQRSTAAHSELLSTSLDDTDSSLQLVNMQLASLLTQATDTEETDE